MFSGSCHTHYCSVPQSHVLRALHHVPAILKAQHRLMAQLCRRLDRAEAANLKVSDFMKEKGELLSVVGKGCLGIVRDGDNSVIVTIMVRLNDF